MKTLAISVLAVSICSSLMADNVINDDLIVDGSGCIGIDCVNGESFGFDTLRLKENNLRINFDDTSVSASFPNNDWRIIINDSSNGGANKFSIEDSTAGRVPLTIEAGAPANSLYVDDGGRLGLGTSTPVTDIHTMSGNTPTLRLEQDGSSGFTPQTWDMAGNEANFFIRDATNGSKLPFRIKPNSPDNSISISSTGVGIGKQTPSVKLDVVGAINATDAITTAYTDSSSASATKLLNLSVNNTNTAKKSDVAFNMANVKSNFSWTFRTFESDEGFTISKDNTGFGAKKEFKLTGLDSVGGMELLLGNGAKNSGGVWINASSRALKENIETLSAEEALDAFDKLQPVKYNYKSNKSEQVLGFIAEDVPELVAINSRDGLSAMDMVALLTKVVQEKNAEMVIMKEEITQLKTMQKRVAKMESLLTNLALDSSTAKKQTLSVVNLK